MVSLITELESGLEEWNGLWQTFAHATIVGFYWPACSGNFLEVLWVKGHVHN